MIVFLMFEHFLVRNSETAAKYFSVKSNFKIQRQGLIEDTDDKGLVVKEQVNSQYPDRGGCWSKT